MPPVLPTSTLGTRQCYVSNGATVLSCSCYFIWKNNCLTGFYMLLIIGKLVSGTLEMKVCNHHQQQELSWLTMVHTTSVCLKFCLGGFQNHCIIRYYL